MPSIEHGYIVEYFDPWGKTLNLYDSDSAASLVAGGITGLVGKTDDDILTVPTKPGRTILAQNIPPMTGELELFVSGEMEKVHKTSSTIRSSFSPIKNGTLIINSPTLGRLSTPVRLSDAIAPPERDPAYEDYIQSIVIPLVSDLGYWQMPEIRESGQVEIINSGFTNIWTKIYWSGQGGKVALPSGYSFVLPEVKKPMVMHLNPFESLLVTDEDGVVDESLWKKLWGTTPECVSPGDKGVFQTPSNIEIGFSLGVLDPWL